MGAIRSGNQRNLERPLRGRYIDGQLPLRGMCGVLADRQKGVRARWHTVDAERPGASIHYRRSILDHAAELRILAQNLASQPGKSGLAHAGLGHQRRDEAAHELEIAGDIALEAGANDGQLAGDLGAQLLLLEGRVLLVGENGGAYDDHHGHRDEQICGAECAAQNLPQTADICREAAHAFDRAPV